MFLILIKKKIIYTNYRILYRTKNGAEQTEKEYIFHKTVMWNEKNEPRNPTVKKLKLYNWDIFSKEDGFTENTVKQ